MPRTLWIGLVVAGALALASMDAGLAAAAGTTVTPARAGFNVMTSASTTASFTTPIGTVRCSESRSRGAVPAAPENAETEEAGTLELAFEPPTFTICSMAGASSATVRTTGEWSMTAIGFNEESSDALAIAMPQETLTITIVTNGGTCTILAPNETSGVMGAWTDGTRGSASRAVLNGLLTFTSSGTCVALCAHLERTGRLTATMSYDITNAAEGGESIVF